MSTNAPFSISLASRSLAELLQQARTELSAQADRHVTQRGITESVNATALTWQAPQIVDEPELPWTPEGATWYLETFVAKHSSTDPRTLATPGTLVFPYTYAARSRFWDGGWAQTSQILETMRERGFSITAATQSFATFSEMVGALGEQVHVQTVLSVLGMYSVELLTRFLAHPEMLDDMVAAWRTDTLESAIRDIGDNPHSRRAVVPSFSYPHLEDQLNPQMGKPPYQLFQLLPDNPDRPIRSIHEHRSLDIVGGAQLDFAHDLAWLREAGQQLNRPVGDITVIAHNLHAYESLEAVDAKGATPEGAAIEQWLCRVTDGYRTGRGIPGRLLEREAYAANAKRIYSAWRRAVTR